jgi:hypothetical protein
MKIIKNNIEYRFETIRHILLIFLTNKQTVFYIKMTF